MSLSFNDAWKIYSRTYSKDLAISKPDLSRWSTHLYPFFQEKQVKKIRTKDIIGFRLYLEEKNLAKQTVKHCLSQVRRILTKSLELELYKGALPYFGMPKFDNKRQRFLTIEECQILLSTLKEMSELWHDITYFCLNTGLRAKEIFTLQCSHINFNTNSITIANSKSYNRTLKLNKICMEIAKKHQTVPQRPLFLFKERPIKKVSKSFKRAINSAKLNQHVTDRLDKVVFHTLRHTYASHLIQNAVSLEVVSRLLGHSSLQMTMRYAHLAPAQFLHPALLLQDLFDNFGKGKNKQLTV